MIKWTDAARRESRAHSRPFHLHDGGFSTVGMVLALLISVSLVLGGTQVYRIQSRASQVQNIADVCALAAEKQVASFYLVAQVCDSAVLSLSLLGLGSIGLGLVAAFVPPLEGASAKLMDVGHEVLKARNRFSEGCIDSLNRLARLLPVFAALDAEALAQSNGGSKGSYHALAVLTPLDGLELELEDAQDEEDFAEEAQESRGKIAQAAKEAEQAAEKCNEHKEKAYQADCGDSPGYCMYERAGSLASLSGSDNPYYASVDVWSFSAALNRARAYYANRLVREVPQDGTVEEAARSAIRRNFYAYACDELSRAYVVEGEDSFSAHFPIFPRNTAEMRETSLYTDPCYPMSADEEGTQTMHAYAGCPGYAQAEPAGAGSVFDMEALDMPCCPYCQFDAASVGKVAAASTSVENGFEHHYRIVAQEAQLYQQQRADFDRASRAAKGPAEGLFGELSDLLGALKARRIHVDPPGSVGAIAIVVDAQGLTVADIVPNSLVSSGGSLGPCVAISAATLAEDDSSETKTVVSSMLDNLVGESVLASVPAALLDIWSGLLVAYSNGGDTLVSGVESALNSLPLVGASGLGTWAAARMRSAVADVGLEAPQLYARKPVTVNSFHVASSDAGAFCRGIVSAKQLYTSSAGPLAADPVSALIGVAGGRVLEHYESWDATFVIARVELLGEGGPSVPLELTLPPALKDAGANAIENALAALLDLSGSMAEVRRWE